MPRPRSVGLAAVERGQTPNPGWEPQAGSLTGGRGGEPSPSCRWPWTTARVATLFFLACTVGGNVLSYLFNVVMSRALGPAEYGVLTSLLAIAVVLAVPATILQLVVARYLAAFEARGRHGQSGALLLRGLRNGGLLGVFMAGSLSTATWPVAWLLHLDRPVLVPAAATILLTGILVPLGNGVLQGLQRFVLLGLNGLLAGVMRLGAGVLLVWLGLGAIGGLLASTISSGFAFLVAIVPVCIALLPKRDRDLEEGDDILSYAGTVLLGTLAFSALQNVDVVVARHFFSPDQAGQYAAAAVLGKIPFYLPGAIAMVMFPRVAAAQARGASTAPLLWKSTGATLLAGLAAALPLLIWPAFFVRLLFGAGYAPAAEIVGGYALAMAALALVQLFLQFYLSTHSRRFVMLLCLDALLLMAGLAIFHPNPGALPIALLINGVAVLVAAEWRCGGLRGRLEEAAPVVEAPPLAGRLSVIMPAHNEADRIVASIAETKRTLESFGWDYELIVVDDGSTDATYARALEATPEPPASSQFPIPNPSDPPPASSYPLPTTRIVQLSRNCGKGMALRYGLLYATGDFIAFLDSDLDLHPRLLADFAARQQASHADVVIGSKQHPYSRVAYPLSRWVVSLGYALLVKALFRLPVLDTQTGLKLFRREVLERVFPRILIKRYALDLELLANAHRLGYRVIEAPVELHFQRKLGRIHPGDVRNACLDTLAVFYRMYILHYYDRIADQAPFAPGV